MDLSNMTPPGSMSKPEPPPIHNENPSCHDLVIADMIERKEFGLKKYGIILQPDNGRNFMVDAYQEVLDLLVYLRGAIYERDAAVKAERARAAAIVANLGSIIGTEYTDPNPKYNTVEAVTEAHGLLVKVALDAIREPGGGK